MIPVSLLLMLCIGLFSAIRVDAAQIGSLNIAPTSAPAMTTPLTDQDGNPVYIADFAGRPLIINFWATWCAPCVVELPSLDRAATILERDDIRVLLVSIDRGGAQKAVPFLADRGIMHPTQAYDPKAKLSREMQIRGVPTTFILSADQKRSWAFTGPFEWDSPDMLAHIRALDL